MGFGESVKHCFRLYAVFRGRASRAEYWWFVAFVVLVHVFLLLIGKYYLAAIALAVVPGEVDTAALISSAMASLVSMALALPLLAVSVRRFHDVGLSGGWSLLALVVFLFSAFQNPRSTVAAYAWMPMLAALGAILVVAVLRGSPGANRYGGGPAAAISEVFGENAAGATTGGGTGDGGTAQA